MRGLLFGWPPLGQLKDNWLVTFITLDKIPFARLPAQSQSWEGSEKSHRQELRDSACHRHIRKSRGASLGAGQRAEGKVKTTHDEQ